VGFVEQTGDEDAFGSGHGVEWEEGGDEEGV
jgi:hypothetical protein